MTFSNCQIYMYGCLEISGKIHVYMSFIRDRSLCHYLSLLIISAVQKRKEPSQPPFFSIYAFTKNVYDPHLKVLERC